MRFGGIAALSTLAFLSLGPSAALTAAPDLSAAVCAAAEFTAHTRKPDAEQTGDSYERVQAWRSLTLDEPGGTGRWITASTAFLLDPASADADAARCAAVDPLTLTPPMPDNPKGDYKACDGRERTASEMTLAALKDFRTKGDAAALCRDLAEAEILLMAQRAEMASGKSSCDMPQSAWIEAGDRVLMNRMVMVATAQATGQSCGDVPGQQVASR